VRATDARGSGYQRDRGQKGLERLTLSREAQQWPGPRANKITSEDLSKWKERQAAGNVATMPLTLAAEMWRAPSAQDPEGGVFDLSKRLPGMNPKIKLRDDAVNWAAPTASAGQNPGSKLKDVSMPIADQAVNYSLPPETRMTNGDVFCDNDRTSRLAYRAFLLMRGAMKHRLNPLFAEWLMGWPERWSTATTDSGSLATEWSHYKQQLHTAFCSVFSGVESNG
jgi:hypothetical protein